jgi:flagellar assembly protein FliH
LAEGREQGLAQGSEEGREIGLRSGHAEGIEIAREQAAGLDELANAVAKALNTLEQEIGQALISLAVRIAEQVLNTTLDNQPKKILDLVGEIINIAPEHNGLLQLRLNPQDLELIQQFFAQDSNPRPYRLIADECITRGGCIAETTLGLIDATLETRWQRVIATLGHTPGKL